MKPLEILVYAVIGLSSLFITAYSVHMLIGGLVSEEVEYRWMGIACGLVTAVIGAMAWDVIRRKH
ncbi:hypothetical protein [Polynucleobacter sphagniphilus]|jgi:hypothetical protein|uniref:hypothetical protein n=1 Tax=Polynucleobacter sphagniphilus TaxID=1743169 RepID=UPI0024753562|nr:hypothetical protein [Polynucleobacter sphagniphilus]MDH6524587.1 putative membrane protein [Polynucleobacter sphagniphilus]